MNPLVHNTIAMLVQLQGQQLQEQEAQHQREMQLMKQQLEMAKKRITELEALAAGPEKAP